MQVQGDLETVLPSKHRSLDCGKDDAQGTRLLGEGQMHTITSLMLTPKRYRKKQGRSMPWGLRDVMELWSVIGLPRKADTLGQMPHVRADTLPRRLLRELAVVVFAGDGSKKTTQRGKPLTPDKQHAAYQPEKDPQLIAFTSKPCTRTFPA